jgi:hypothetical protein
LVLIRGERQTGHCIKMKQSLASEYSLLMKEMPLEIRRVILFQHTETPSHFIQDTAFLNQRYENIWIDCRCLITWPPRSAGHAPLDLFSWVLMDEMTYRNKVHAAEEILLRIVGNATTVWEHIDFTLICFLYDLWSVTDSLWNALYILCSSYTAWNFLEKKSASPKVADGFSLHIVASRIFYAVTSSFPQKRTTQESE